MRREATGTFLNAYEQHADAIYRHCYFRVSSPERARELMQEAFMRTWKYLADGHDIENIRAFLYRVANNLIIDEYRKKKEIGLDTLEEDVVDAEGSTPGRIRDLADAKRAIRLLSRLDGKYREALVMRYIDGMTPEEIARITNETANTVSVHIHRALKQVRKLMDYGTGN